MHIKAITISVFATVILAISNAHAACTYSEAMMAFRQGNEVRGVALMRMAASDGDARAARYLVKIGDKSVNPEMRQLIMADNKTRSEPLLWERVK
jgi:hypothetical protein